MKIFFYVLSMSVTSSILYFFVPLDDLNKVEDIMLKSEKCQESEIEQLGLKKTFTDLSYIFGIIGAFWGASNTVENGYGVWWEATFLNLTLKVFTTVIFNILYFYVSSILTHPTFELNFLLSGFKYFAHYYIIMGILPIVFEKSGLNEIKENIIEKKDNNTLLKKNSQLFSKTIFSQKVSKDNILDEDIITSKFKPLLNQDKEKDTRKEKKEGIYKKSLLIGGVTKHKVNGNFEFSMDKEDEAHNISGNEENYFNQNSIDEDNK